MLLGNAEPGEINAESIKLVASVIFLPAASVPAAFSSVREIVGTDSPSLASLLEALGWTAETSPEGALIGLSPTDGQRVWSDPRALELLAPYATKLRIELIDADGIQFLLAKDRKNTDHLRITRRC